jgi:hypothetical protein
VEGAVQGGVLAATGAAAVEALEADIEAVGVVLSETDLGLGQTTTCMVLRG